MPKHSTVRPSAAGEPSMQQFAGRSLETTRLRALQALVSTGRAPSTHAAIQRQPLVRGRTDVPALKLDDAMGQIIELNVITDLAEADAIEEIIAGYVAEDRTFESLAELLTQARADLEGEDGAEVEDESEADREPELISAAMASTSGDQYTVQAKMAGITRHLRAQMLQGDDDEADRTSAFAKEVLINGLCGGWATLFLQHPDWVESTYNAVRTWERPDEMKARDVDALRHFEAHLKRRSRFRGAEQVVHLLSETYERMSELEPDAGYDSRPRWTRGLVADDLPEAPSFHRDAAAEAFKLKLKGRSAAEVVCDKIMRLTEGDGEGECMAHIESDMHHMALRLQKRKVDGRSRKFRTLVTVVESEKSGFVTVNDLSAARVVLDRWLAVEEPDLATIVLRTRTIGFK